MPLLAQEVPRPLALEMPILSQEGPISAHEIPILVKEVPTPTHEIPILAQEGPISAHERPILAQVPVPSLTSSDDGGVWKG